MKINYFPEPSFTVATLKCFIHSGEKAIQTAYTATTVAIFTVLLMVLPSGVQAGVSVTTLAGTAGSVGSADGTGGAARFNLPSGVTVDNSGNLYVADSRNQTIRKVTPGGMVSTMAGVPGSFGSADGTGSAAQFNGPSGIAVDKTGNVYVADYYNATIRKITPGGLVSTLAGSPIMWDCTDGTGSAARFFEPQGVAVDNNGDLYVADTYNHTIRRVTSGGVVTTLAGMRPTITITPYTYTTHPGSADGTGSAAMFLFPIGVAVDSSGNAYVADRYNHAIRKVTPSGVVTTLAGTLGSPGFLDGTGSAARFNFPQGVAVDKKGNVYVADTDNHTIRKVTPGGVVTTLAGTVGTSGSLARLRGFAG